MSNTTTSAKTLILRDLSPELNDALNWGKRYFQEATNSKAAERMLLSCTRQGARIRELEEENRELRWQLRELLQAAQRVADLQVELELARQDLGDLMAKPRCQNIAS